MNGYFLSTLSVIIILAFFDAIVSKTKNGKSVKIIISLFSTFLLLTPILKVFKGGDFNSNLSSISYYEEYLNSLEDEVMLSKIKFALNRGNLNFNDVLVVYENTESEKTLIKITIFFNDLVINDENENINMLENVKKLLENTIDVNKVEIEIETVR